MELLVLLGLFGSVALAGILSDHGDDAEADADADRNPDAPLPEEPDDTGSDLIFGDTIAVTVDDTLVTITGTPGDDVIDEFRHGRAYDIFAGPGDDVIENLPYYSDVYGGEGDDVISTHLAGDGEIHGDAGNDVITVPAIWDGEYPVEYSPYDGSIDVLMYGGEGDDVINMRQMFFYDTDIQFTYMAEGGAGADTFNLDLVLTGDYDSVYGRPTQTGSFVIRDFDPNEDHANLTITRNPDASFRVMTDAHFEYERYDDVDGVPDISSELHLTFAGDGTQPETTSIITFRGAAIVTWDHVTIRQN